MMLRGDKPQHVTTMRFDAPVMEAVDFLTDSVEKTFPRGQTGAVTLRKVVQQSILFAAMMVRDETASVEDFAKAKFSEEF